MGKLGMMPDLLLILPYPNYLPTTGKLQTDHQPNNAPTHQRGDEMEHTPTNAPEDPRLIEEGKWYLYGDLLYTLMHHGWRKGVEQFCNNETIRCNSPELALKVYEAISSHAKLKRDRDALLKALKALRIMLPSDDDTRVPNDKIPAGYCYVRWTDLKQATDAIVQAEQED